MKRRKKAVHWARRVEVGLGCLCFSPLCSYLGFTALARAYNLDLTTDPRGVTCKLCLEVLEARKRGGLPC